MAIIGPGIARVWHAERTKTTTTDFNTNLSPSDDTVQKALDTLDEVAGGGGGLPMLSGATNPNTTQAGTFGQHYRQTGLGVDLIYVCTATGSPGTWVLV